MYGFSLGWLPVLFWCFLTPTFTMLLFVYSVIKYEQLAYRRAGQTTPYEFPIWSVNLGWLMASSTLFLIPIAMIVQILQTSGPFFQRLRTLLTPKLPDHSIEEMNSLRSSGAIDGTASNPICEIIRLSMEDDYEGASNRHSLPNGT
ncbi:unnamed protein product [Dicrocoelium dendriticum]|nr:unnamed protein product [Dicrocoelium dendriticum]CAH8591039.1 unnamed protein product [Dicrocoelium dendriticum]